jgi:hypothetical protein
MQPEGTSMHVSVGYIKGPLTIRASNKPVTRDGGSFYSISFTGKTEAGENFTVSAFSVDPINFQGAQHG